MLRYTHYSTRCQKQPAVHRKSLLPQSRSLAKMHLLKINAAVGCKKTCLGGKQYIKLNVGGGRRSGRLDLVHGPSKDAARSSCLLFATGDGVAASIDATDPESVVHLPSTVATRLMVYNTSGGKSTVDVLPGLTTVAQIRAEIAQKLRIRPDQVRLAYAGKELDPTDDDMPLGLKAGVDVIAAIHRLQGGGVA